MNTFQKIAMGIVGVAIVTTLILPNRQTPKVINAFASLTTGALGTAMGISKSGNSGTAGVVYT